MLLFASSILVAIFKESQRVVTTMDIGEFLKIYYQSRISKICRGIKKFFAEILQRNSNSNTIAQDPCTISPRIFLHESSDKRLLLLSACIGKIFPCFMPRKCIVWYTNRSIVYEMLSHAGNIVCHELKCNENGKKHCETGYYFRNGSSATNDFLSLASLAFSNRTN